MQPALSPARPTRIRHVVLGLTVAAYMITYIDRVIISSAAPLIRKEFGFSMVTMGLIFSSFRWGYALFQIPGGWLGDRIGPRRALSLIVSWWSAFMCATTAAFNATSMIVSQSLFGVGEAGAFPTATRSLSRWLLPAERATAQGLTHAGSRLGAALTPPLVVLLMRLYGWRAPFWVFATVGWLWAAGWYFYYRDNPGDHASVNAAERDMIHAASGRVRAATGAPVPWRSIFASPTLWLISPMYFCYGYCLAVYLDWFPTYLHDGRGFTLKEMGFYASLPLLAGTVADFAGGWLSDRLLSRSGNVTSARRIVASGGFLLASAGIIPATLTQDPRACVAFSCVAVFGLELTVGVSWAVPLDIGGDYAGSVASVMNMCGNIGGAISTQVLGYLAEKWGWNTPFLVASAACAVAALLFAKIDASKRIFD